MYYMFDLLESCDVLSGGQTEEGDSKTGFVETIFKEVECEDIAKRLLFLAFICL